MWLQRTVMRRSSKPIIGARCVCHHAPGRLRRLAVPAIWANDGEIVVRGALVDVVRDADHGVAAEQRLEGGVQVYRSLQLVRVQAQVDQGLLDLEQRLRLQAA